MKGILFFAGSWAQLCLDSEVGSAAESDLLCLEAGSAAQFLGSSAQGGRRQLFPKAGVALHLQGWRISHLALALLRLENLPPSSFAGRLRSYTDFVAPPLLLLLLFLSLLLRLLLLLSRHLLLLLYLRLRLRLRLFLLLLLSLPCSCTCAW